MTEKIPVFRNDSRALTEEELSDIELWQRGRVLSGIVNTEAWEMLLAALQSYVEQADYDLRRLPPGDPGVVTAHAALSALDQGFRLFKEDIESAVANSETVPEALQGTVRGPQ